MYQGTIFKHYDMILLSYRPPSLLSITFCSWDALIQLGENFARYIHWTVDTSAKLFANTSLKKLLRNKILEISLIIIYIFFHSH